MDFINQEVVMSKKLISIILAFALLIQIVGCYSYQEITKEEFVQTEEYLDLQVRTKSQSIYKFDKGSYTAMEDSIYGSGKLKLKTGTGYYKDFTGSIPLKDIESFKFDKFDTASTIVWSAIGVGVIVWNIVKPNLIGIYGFFAGSIAFIVWGLSTI